MKKYNKYTILAKCDENRFYHGIEITNDQDQIITCWNHGEKILQFGRDPEEEELYCDIYDTNEFYRYTFDMQRKFIDAEVVKLVKQDKNRFAFQYDKHTKELYHYSFMKTFNNRFNDSKL